MAGTSDVLRNRPGGAGSRFATTRWSVVAAAGRRHAPASREALETLCRAYWYPLYAYVRRHGRSPQDAQDLTQAFFTVLLEKNYVGAADRGRGRFRTFLLTAFQRFLAKEHARARAQKRGGDRRALTLDFSAGENRYLLEPVDLATPERLFERRWALTLLDHVLARVAADYAAQGKAELFAALKPLLAAGRDRSTYGRLAEELGMTEGAVKVAAHRLRRRYRDVLRDEIAQTLASPEEVEDELNQLMAAVSG